MKRLVILLMLLLTSTAFAVYAAPDEATVIAVGGDSSAATNGGGATLVAWNTSGDPTDFIGVNGGPIVADTGVTYTNGTTTLSKAGVGTGVTVGTLAYISGTNITTGIYEVTGQTADTLVFADIDATGDNEDSVVNVGGTLDTLQVAIDNPVNNAAAMSRWIYTFGETVTASIDIDQFSGTATTMIYIVGYNATFTTEAIATIVTATDLSASNNGIINNTGQDFIEFRNIDFDGGNATDDAVYCIQEADGCTYISYVNCKIHGASSHGVLAGNGNVCWINCEFYDNGGKGLEVEGSSLVIDCKAHDNTNHGIDMRTNYSSVVNSQAYDNGGDGIFVTGYVAAVILIGNTSYGNASDGFYIDENVTKAWVVNNTASGNGAYGYNLDGNAMKNLGYFGYNHSYNDTSGPSDMALTDEKFLVFMNGSNRVGNPLFTSVTDGSENFTPTSGSDLINNGLGASTQDIGAIQEASPSGGQHSTKQGGKQ